MTLATYTAILISIYKPLVMLALVAGWAWAGSHIDKESAKHRLGRAMWNGILLGTAAAGVAIWLLLPWFWLGLTVGLLFMVGGLGAYVYEHNRKVEPQFIWKFDLQKMKDNYQKKAQEQVARAARVMITTSQGQTLPHPTGEMPGAAAHMRMEDLVDFALPRSVSKIEMAVSPEKARLLAHIDGVRYRLPDIDAPSAVALVDYMKAAAKLDVADRRRKQTGKMHIRSIVLGPQQLEITTFGSTRELVLAIVFNPHLNTLPKFDAMGFLNAQVEQLRPVLKDQTRVVIGTSPTGQGQTTLLYAMLSQHDPYTNNIVTLETQPERELEGITHKKIELKEFVPRLQTLMRQDPSILMLSQIEDGQLAQLAAQAGGQVRTYVGMRFEDTFTALKAWVKAVGDPQEAANSLAAIVSSRTVRKLCTVCRVGFQPDPAALKKLNLSDTITQLYRNSGQVMGKKGPEICPACQGLSYRGRTGVYEVMVLDDEARAILAQGQLDQLRNHLRKHRMLWLQEAALAKAVEGVTSIQEITRALSAEADKVVALPSFEPPPGAQGTPAPAGAPAGQAGKPGRTAAATTPR